MSNKVDEQQISTVGDLLRVLNEWATDPALKYLTDSPIDVEAEFDATRLLLMERTLSDNSKMFEIRLAR